MALVNNDQIEEVLRILAVQPWAVFIAGHGLIDGKVHIPALDRPATPDFLPGVAERAKVLCHRIINQDVAVGEEQNLGSPARPFGVPACRPELPADLERDRGLARAGTQGQENALTPLQNGLHRAIDRGLLVVAERLCPVGIARCEQGVGHTIIDIFCGSESEPQFLGLGELRNDALDTRRIVELDDLDAVGRIGEFQAEDFGIALGLLKSVARPLIAGLGLNDRNGKVRTVAQQVVGTLLSTAPGLATGKDDPPVRERPLLLYGVERFIPSGLL